MCDGTGRKNQKGAGEASKLEFDQMVVLSVHTFKIEGAPK